MDSFTRHNPTDGKPLHGRVLANPPVPQAVIAIVHGFGEHGGRYSAIANRLAADDIAALALDLHGHGKTPGARGDVEEYERLREDVDALLDEARDRFPDVPLFVWGHSMGGGLVLDYMLDRGGVADVKGVIVTAPLIEAVEPPPAPLRGLLRVIRKVHPRFAVKTGLDATKISSIPEEQERYANDPLNHDRLGVRLGLAILGHGKNLLKDAHRFPLPLLHMHARGDRLTDFTASETFAAGVPDCNFVAFEDVEHELHNDTSRERVVELITDFMETHA